MMCTTSHFNTLHSSTINPSDLTTVMVIAEGKERNEIGFSIFDIENQPVVYLNQIVDNFWFTDVCKKILAFDVKAIIIPDMLLNTLSTPKLLQIMIEKFPYVPHIKLNFRFFDAAKGLELVKNLCVPEKLPPLMVQVQGKNYALASFAAVSDYLIRNIGASFAPGTLRIEFLVNFGKLSIDIDTIYRLELIKTASITKKEEGSSLFGVMNTCVTKLGKNALRALILEPSSDLNVIIDRQNCIEELLNESSPMHDIKVTMSKFQEIHKLLKLPYVISQANTSKGSEMMINAIVLLKTTLQDLSELANCVQKCSSAFFKHMCIGLKNFKYESLLNKIEEILLPEAQSASKSRSSFQRMFAVRTGVNEYLDLIRKYFSQYVDEIRDHIQTLATEYNLPFRMTHTIHKGFHIQLYLTNTIKDPPIPGGIEVILKTSKCISMIDAKLYELNFKVSKIANEVELLSNGIIQALYNHIRSEIHIIYSLIDIITELDVLLALAEYSKCKGTVRPTFGAQTEVVDGIHPLMECCWKQEQVVSNSFHATTEYNFFVITGNNMSGKTVYIKMIATMQILAQLGCWVTATSAQFRTCDKILTRIGFEDSIEQNASSFTIEMREIEFILRNITPLSLVIVDELCRSTNVGEAQVLSWCFCEKLIKFYGFQAKFSEEISVEQEDADNTKLCDVTAPFIFLTTHFEHLLKLSDKYMNVTNLILTKNYQASVYNEEEHNNYEQLKLAKSVKLPQSVIENAEQLLSIPGLIHHDHFMETITNKGILPITQATSVVDRSTISSILSGLSNNPKDIYDIFSIAAKEFRNPNKENRQQHYELLKSQLIGRIQSLLGSGDSSNLFNEDST